MGSHSTVEIDHALGTRAFDGIVCESQHRGSFENGWRYDLVLRPWLHVVGLRRNMRIFHNKTVIDIVEEVLGAYADLGNPHLEVRVTGEYPVLEYTVQYGESDADFIRRQLERFGITWSWRHEAGSHMLLLSDVASTLPEVPGSSRPYYGVKGYHRAGEEHFRLWSSAQRISTGAVRLTEYNFKTPTAAQEVDKLGDASHVQGDVESYDWPGDYLDQGEGRGVVNRRLDAERGQAPRHQAEGDVVSLGAGWRVTLAGDEVAGATGRTFICLKATHRFRAQAYGSGDSGNDETPYDGTYILTPDDTPFHPERRTNGPRVQGPETAVVVGDGEIDCDAHGRILVRFHWYLDAAHTMRVRVSQNWASKGWGGMVIPRIGMEVIVEHLRGEPDKPIVTGCVYNGLNTPPYALLEHKTRSTFKTDTHQGTGFNELRFEDWRGKEEIFVHAQNDMNIEVRRNRAQDVGGHSHVQTTRNMTQLTGRFEAHYSGLGMMVSTGGSLSLSSGRGSPVASLNRAFFRDGGTVNTHFSNLMKDPEENLANRRGSINFNAAAEMSAQAGVDVSIGAGESISISAMESISSSTGEDIRMTAGKSIMTYAGANLVLASDGAMILRAGESELILRPNGEITLKGTLIKMNADKICLN